MGNWQGTLRVPLPPKPLASAGLRTWPSEVREQGIEEKFFLDANSMARHSGRQPRIPGGRDRLVGGWISEAFCGQTVTAERLRMDRDLDEALARSPDPLRATARLTYTPSSPAARRWRAGE
jgi:hypothetical protein